MKSDTEKFSPDSTYVWRVVHLQTTPGASDPHLMEMQSVIDNWNLIRNTYFRALLVVAQASAFDRYL